jgi:hypothetical protein
MSLKKNMQKQCLMTSALQVKRVGKLRGEILIQLLYAILRNQLQIYTCTQPRMSTKNEC